MHQARLNSLLLLLMLVSAGGRAAGHAAVPEPTLRSTLPEASIACSANKQIYRNRTRTAITVTIQATDNCPNSTKDQSAITLVVPGEKDQKEEFEDGDTITISFSVPPEGVLWFWCSGTAGTGCSYSLSVP